MGVLLVLAEAFSVMSATHTSAPLSLTPFFGRRLGWIILTSVLTFAAGGKRGRPLAALVLEKRAKAAARRRATAVATPRTRGLSYLEGSAVRTPTARSYQDKATDFVQWCWRNQMAWSTDRELDHALTIFLDETFFLGASGSDGSTLIAALRHYMPILARDGPAQLPRAMRALHAWKRLAPRRQRLPLPLVALAAMIGAAYAMRRVEAGLRWWPQFRTYLRPGVCDSLKVKQLVPPLAAAGRQYQFWGLLLALARTRSRGRRETSTSPST